MGCMGMCKDMCIDMCIDMCTDMCRGMCIDICIAGTPVEMRESIVHFERAQREREQEQQSDVGHRQEQDSDVSERLQRLEDSQQQLERALLTQCMQRGVVGDALLNEQQALGCNGETPATPSDRDPPAGMGGAHEPVAGSAVSPDFVRSMGSELESLANRVAGLEARLGGIDGLEARLGGIDGLEARLGEIDERTGRLCKLEQECAALAQRVLALQSAGDFLIVSAADSVR